VGWRGRIRDGASTTVQRDLRVLAGWVDQSLDLLQKLPGVAASSRLRIDPTERKQPADLLLGHGQLTEGQVQRVVSLLGGESSEVKLNAHSYAGERVA
jgi:hypothetical protein